jgi:hypothetical protein
MLAPNSLRAIQHSWPMPDDAPVTKIRRPVKSNGLLTYPLRF